MDLINSFLADTIFHLCDCISMGWWFTDHRVDVWTLPRYRCIGV